MRSWGSRALAVIALVGLLGGCNTLRPDLGDTSGPGYDELDLGVGARFGEWIAWRPDTNHLLITHGKDRVAIEIWTTSNGWFRYVWSGGSYVVWSIATQSPQGFDTDYASFLERGADLNLGHKAVAIGTYRVRFENGHLLLVCTANRETIELSPNSSRFLFHGLADKTIELPMP